MSIDNPYSPPAIEESNQNVRKVRWRVIPVALLYIVGGGATLMGLFAMFMVAVVAWRVPTGMPIGLMMLVSISYLGFGLSWLLAGWSIWKGRYLRGILFCVGSAAACAIIFYVVTLLQGR